jgi:hypothetical protein
MPTADNGNFDVTIEASRTLLRSTLAGTIATGAAPQTIDSNGVRALVTPQLSLVDIMLSPDNSFTATIDLAGSTIDVQQVPFLPGPIPPGMGQIPLAGTLNVTDTLEMRLTTFVVDLSPDAARGQPSVEVHLDEAKLFGSGWLMMIAMYLDLLGISREKIVELLETGVHDAVVQSLNAKGLVTLVPPPAAPALGLVPASAALLTQRESLHLLYRFGGTSGTPSLITRSMLAAGSGERAALSLSNAFILRDLLRPAIAVPLGLSPAGFLPSHPCAWTGSAPVGVAPTGVATASINSMLAGIDEAGLVHVVLVATATGTGGSFTLTATIDISMRVTVTQTGTGLSISIAPAGPPAVSSDYSIAWWVYGIGVLTGSGSLLTVLAVIDAFGGLFSNGPISGAVFAALPSRSFNIPLALPGLTLSRVRQTQPDAPRRTLLGLPDPFRSHDLIMTFV